MTCLETSRFKTKGPIDPDHIRVVGCYLDIARTDPSNWSLEIDFIHSAVEPTDGGWSVLRRLCDLVGAKKTSIILKDSSPTSYATAHFTSKKRALRASRMIARALGEMDAIHVGLCPRNHRQEDPMQMVYSAALDFDRKLETYFD